jgi:RNA polymerase sigma factor (sigma-70 family)
VDVRIDRKVVHIVDDDASFRKAIDALLTRYGYEVFTYPSAQHLLDQLPSNDVPSCIILDVRLRPEMSGPELQGRLIELGVTLPIIFLTGYEDIPTTVRTIKAGSEDFFIKPVESDQLLSAIDRAMTRHVVARDERQRLQKMQSLLSRLTPRERQVFDLVVRGKTNKQIGFELGATARTIKAHRHQIMEKIKVRSLTELVTTAERLGLLA